MYSPKDELTMINQLEVPMYLEEAIPEISLEKIVNNQGSIYKEMSMLVTFTCNNIKDQNYQVVKRCFNIADKLYGRGNATVKNAVENVFVFSFTNMLHSYPAEKKQVLSMIPITLYMLYVAHVCHSGN